MEYDEMAIERRDNDKQLEEMRAQIDEIERKVGFVVVSSIACLKLLL